jgi:integrase
MSLKKTRKKYKIDPRKWPGVYGYDSEKRTVQGKPDVSYYILYRVADRLVWEKVGWKSEGYTPQIASETRSERIRKARHGEAVKTAKELAREQQLRDRTLDEIATAYFKSDHGKNLKGRKTDINRYENHLKPVLGKRRISTLAPLDVERVKANMKGKAAATIANALELLRRLINFGAKFSLCNTLEFNIQLPKKNNEIVEYLEPDQADRLVKTLDLWRSTDVVRMLKLAMVTGLRRSEIFKLENQDLDFTQGLIKIRDPKGKKTVTIPMNRPAKKILQAQVEWRDLKFLKSLYIFPGRRGGRRVDCSAVDRIKAKANLPKKFRIFHGLRHHFAVTLANSGEFTLDMIGELLTHKSAAMTRRYSQFLPSTMKEASEKAAALVQEQAISGQKLEEINIGVDDGK